MLGLELVPRKFSHRAISHRKKMRCQKNKNKSQMDRRDRGGRLCIPHVGKRCRMGDVKKKQQRSEFPREALLSSCLLRETLGNRCLLTLNLIFFENEKPPRAGRPESRFSTPSIHLQGPCHPILCSGGRSYF